MNPQHLRAFLWLRWRLLVNQMKKGGTTSVIVLAILAVLLVACSAGLFVIFFSVGLFGLTEANVSPAVVLLVWDGLVVVFLFCWMIGLLTELQRSEVLSLDKFLHLPVSLTSAFLINYLSSLLSISLAVFVPAMIGLALGLAFSWGPVMLLVLPALAAFVLMVTALTYQFQSWLAALMANKRRRRTVLAVVTMVFVLVCQAPQAIHFFTPSTRQLQERANQLKQQQDDLLRAFQAGQITHAEYRKRSEEVFEAHRRQDKEEGQQLWRKVQRVAHVVNLALPPGWLPLAAEGAAERSVLPALLGTLGLTLLGVGSLWRSYRTTLRLYTGHYTSGARRAAAPAAPAAPPPVKDGKPTSHLLERELPGASEQAAAIALAGFRSLTRAPEAKMLLLGPVILVLVFGSLLFSQQLDPPEGVRPLMAYGAVASVLFCLVQLVGNQFGFDRAGFRVFVLSPAPRREVLLGKNLAIAPLALGLSAFVLALLEAVYPMPAAYFLAALTQAVSMYLIFCMLANCLSILAPLRMAPGTTKPVNMKMVPFLFHLAFLFLFPLALSPTLLPLGVESLAEALGWDAHGVLCLLLSLAECAAVVYLYRLVLTWQGHLLQAREQKVLELVITKAE